MQSNADQREFLTVEEVAAICRVTPDTVYRWDYGRTAPPRVKLGKHVIYPAREFRAWLASRRQT
jgi:predicted DNA-binding transcriptional regulator AlpA